jgi:hypothetical protein
MPARPSKYVTPIYVERLSIKARWWVVVLAIALFGSSELFAGFGGRVIAVVVAAVVVPTLVLLALAGRTVLRIDAAGLHVGGESISLEQMDSVEALDEAATRLALGPQADPAAKLFVRGYIRTSIRIRPVEAGRAPYWLVSTRHPAQVIAAVEQAARGTPAR